MSGRARVAQGGYSEEMGEARESGRMVPSSWVSQAQCLDLAL